jgi:hypothetical protein
VIEILFYVMTGTEPKANEIRGAQKPTTRAGRDTRH